MIVDAVRYARDRPQRRDAGGKGMRGDPGVQTLAASRRPPDDAGEEYQLQNGLDAGPDSSRMRPEPPATWWAM